MKAPGDRYLIIRMSSAGDVIHGLPVVRALKKARPDAEIAWLVEDRFADLLKGNPDLDEILILPRRAWREWSFAKRTGTVWKLLQKIRRNWYQTTLDLQCLSKSALAAWFSGAPRRVGFASPDGREISTLLNNTLVSPSVTHVVERNLALLDPLGITADRAEFPAPPPPNERVTQFLGDSNLTPGDFVIINPGAGWPAKRWPLERFGNLAKELSQLTDKQVVITWGGDAEKKMALEIVASSPKNCMIAPETDLLELGSLLAQARLFIGCDTGPLHLAAAAGVKCIGLFGPTSGERNGPYGEGNTVLQGRCKNHPLCWKKRWRDKCRCMQEIQVAEVIAACRERL